MHVLVSSRFDAAPIGGDLARGQENAFERLTDRVVGGLLVYCVDVFGAFSLRWLGRSIKEKNGNILSALLADVC